jgi:hypothetical protein
MSAEQPDHSARFIKAAHDHGGVLGKAAILALMAEAWDEGRKHGASYPYGKRGLASDDNPYRALTQAEREA